MPKIKVTERFSFERKGSGTNFTLTPDMDEQNVPKYVFDAAIAKGVVAEKYVTSSGGKSSK